MWTKLPGNSCNQAPCKITGSVDWWQTVIDSGSVCTGLPCSSDAVGRCLCVCVHKTTNDMSSSHSNIKASIFSKCAENIFLYTSQHLSALRRSMVLSLVMVYNSLFSEVDSKSKAQENQVWHSQPLQPVSKSLVLGSKGPLFVSPVVTSLFLRCWNYLLLTHGTWEWSCLASRLAAFVWMDGSLLQSWLPGVTSSWQGIWGMVTLLSLWILNSSWKKKSSDFKFLS